MAIQTQNGESGNILLYNASYESCIRGVMEKDQEIWQKRCLEQSIYALRAPLLSVFFPIEYFLREPAAITHASETELGIGRVLVAKVQQTFPFGKETVVFARIRTILVHDQTEGPFCFFIGENASIIGVHTQCDIREQYWWKPGQAGFEGRYKDWGPQLRGMIETHKFEIEVPISGGE